VDLSPQESCGGRTWVHASYNDPKHWSWTTPNRVSDGAAYVAASFGTVLSPSNIAVWVCDIANGVRRCGAAIHV
jgi:hypothetical protein